MTRDFFDPTPAQQNVTLIDAATLRDAERLIESCEHCNPVGSEIPFDWILDLGGPQVVEEENYRNDQATHLCGKAGSRQAGTDLATLSLAKNGAGKSHFCGQRESAVARVLQLREDRSQCVAPVAIDVLQGLAGMRQNLL